MAEINPSGSIDPSGTPKAGPGLTPQKRSDPPLALYTNDATFIPLEVPPQAAIAGINGQTSAIGVYGSAGGAGGAGVVGDGSAGAAGVQGTSDSFDAVVGETGSDAHAGVTGRNLTNGGEGGVGIYGTGGQFAGKFDGNLQVNGDAHVTGTLIVDGDIVLTKGADCAEQFDVSLQTIVEPGTVMVIAGCGELEPSRLPYDKRVAGIISGAGTLRPAIILDSQQSERGRAIVALFGKVYCKVDADAGSVEVGDLLTTSAISGHAMKAADSGQSFGAVIGKALQPMKSGKGLIPVLIALQ